MSQSLFGTDSFLGSLLQQLVGKILGKGYVVEDGPDVTQALRPIE
jgi:hypothetical protein